MFLGEGATFMRSMAVSGYRFGSQTLAFLLSSVQRCRWCAAGARKYRLSWRQGIAVMTGIVQYATWIASHTIDASSVANG